MTEPVCAKCNKPMARVSKWYRCSKCQSHFCPSCMDRFCLFCKGAVAEAAKPA